MAWRRNRLCRVSARGVTYAERRMDSVKEHDFLSTPSDPTPIRDMSSYEFILRRPPG